MAPSISPPVMETIGEYDLIAKVAEGGAGTVYKARRRDTGEVFALKVMLPSKIGNRVMLQRFEQEFHTARALSHPNIVRAYDFRWEGARPYLVMEFIEGESLGERIERAGPMREDEAIGLIAQVCQGLHQAHAQGVIHRDVKPDNIMVTPEGQAKLTDLGLVKETDADLNLTKTGRGLGTPHFMAPEQFRNAKNADARSDVYSLAATLYQMVTGEIPFGSCSPMDAWMRKIENRLKPPRRLVPGLSKRTEAAILRAMHVDPAERPASCLEFAEELTKQGQAAETAPPSDDAGQWFVIYQNADGLLEKVTGATEDVRRRLTEGGLGVLSAVHASRCPQGPFEALAHYPEFRDLLAPATLTLDLSPGDPPPLLAAPIAPLLRLPPRPAATGAPPPSSTNWFAWLAAVAAAGLAAAVTAWLLG